MLWYKKYDYNMKNDVRILCNEYTENFRHEPFNTYKSVQDSKMWNIPPIGENRKRLWDIVDYSLVKQFRDLKDQIKKITGLELQGETSVDCIWRFDKNFKHCPVHVDVGGEHTGTVCSTLSGNFKFHLHEEDKQDSKIIDTIDVEGLIVLNNTNFPHSVEGQGDLLVVGIDHRMNPKEYFANV